MYDLLITGGAGFLGAALARATLARGRSVACLDVADFDRLADVAGDPRLACLQADVRDPAAVAAAVADARAVAHLAAVVGVDRYARDPRAVFDVNIGGTQVVLGACARLQRPVLVASTSEVYGRLPYDLAENAGGQFGDLAQGRWSYALSKAVGEQTAHALGATGLAFTIARFFNVYGPTMDRPGQGRVISRFLGHLQRGEALPLVDGGEAVRCFCYVDDAVAATLRLLDGLQAGAEAVRGRAFNIGRREPVTMRELATRMAALSGHEAGTVDVAGSAVFGPGFEEIPRRVPDLTALREVLGYEAPTPLDVGLGRVLQHHGLLRQPPPQRPPELVPMVRPVFAPDAALLGSLVDALHSGRVTNQGPVVQRFERELADWLGADEAVACGSGTAGLTAALVALGRRGKAVLPAFTYIGTLNAVCAAGLEPLFVDVEPGTWTLDPRQLATLLRRHRDVAAVLPVNVFGVPADLPAIAALARVAGAAVVCDDAHAGGTEGGHPDRAGQDAADLRVVSLHATKVLPAVEGGVVVARDAALLAEVRRLVHHGLDPIEPLRSGPGFNFKLSELHAAVGRHSLRRLPAVLARRRAYAERLRTWLAERCGDTWQVQAAPAGVRPHFQNLGVRLRPGSGHDVETVRMALRARGLEARRYFWPPLHVLPRFAGTVRLAETEDLTRHQLCLPLHDTMDEALLRRIEQAVAAVAVGVVS